MFQEPPAKREVSCFGGVSDVRNTALAGNVGRCYGGYTSTGGAPMLAVTTLREILACEPSEVLT